ncbi:hypothetical protein ACFQZC_36675 [Streptacidiphilus monticola]
MKRFDEDFTEEQVARSRARRRDTLPLRYASAAVGLVVPCLLGFTPLGAAVIAAVGDLAGAAGRRGPLRVPWRCRRCCRWWGCRFRCAARS